MKYLRTCKKDTHSSDIKLGHCTCSCLISRTKCKIDVVQNGGAPTKSSYIIQPSDHRSALWSYGCSSINSGAIYNGVPLIDVKTWVPVLILRANPKSHNFAQSFTSNNIFWGFKSLKKSIYMYLQHKISILV